MQNTGLKKPASILAGLISAMLILPSGAMAGGWVIDPNSTVNTTGEGDRGSDKGTDAPFNGALVINNTSSRGYADPITGETIYDGVSAASSLITDHVRFKWDGSDGSIPPTDNAVFDIGGVSGYWFWPSYSPWVITVRGNMIAHLDDAGTAGGIGVVQSAFDKQQNTSSGELFKKGVSYQVNGAGFTSQVAQVSVTQTGNWLQDTFTTGSNVYYLYVPVIEVTASADAYNNGGTNNAWAFAACWLDAPRLATKDDLTPGGPDTPPVYTYAPGPGGDTEPTQPMPIGGDPGGGYDFGGGGGNSGGGTDF